MLSEREKEILILVAEGLSNRQIAGQLDISENTVKVHLRNIFAKISVSSRTEASLYAVRQGWVVITPVEVPVETTPPVVPVLPVVWWRRRWVWLLVVGLILVGSGVGGWRWWSGAPRDALVVAENARWQQIPGLPVAQPHVQFVAYRGALYALCAKGEQGAVWWQYAADQAQWQHREDLPFACTDAVVVAHRDAVWVFEQTTRTVWRWDGVVWQQMAAIPDIGRIYSAVPWGGYVMVAVDGGSVQQLWTFDVTQATWQLRVTQSQDEVWYLANLNDVIYVFTPNQQTVWHYDEQTQALQPDADMTVAWQQPLAVEVLGSLLVVDAPQQMMWSYLPREGMVRQQSIPVDIGGATQVIAWQAMLLFPNADGSQIWGYQAVYQTFVPVIE